MKRIIDLLVTLVLIFVLTACSLGQTGTSVGLNTAQTSTIASNESTQASSDVVGTSVSTAVSTGSASVADALAENSEVHEDAQDYVWEITSVIPITLDENSIIADGAGVRVDGSQATITSAGTYNISGSLEDGQIVVNTEDKGIVRLIFNGMDIRNLTSAPIYVIKAEKTVIILADNTENTVTDGEAYVFEVVEEEEPNAAIFSKSNLTIYGGGSLTVNGNFRDGISSKDGLIIASGTITVSSPDDGIRGKDYLVVKGGSITINAQGDGLKSDNEEDATKGYISIESGSINITSVGDAVHAQTDVTIVGGDITIASGGGSNNRADENTSAKGIKAVSNVNIDGGTFTIDSADDAIHTNGNLVINGGVFNISSADDGMHADSTLAVNGSNIQITKSYEGIESAVITINAGTIFVVASDDGINVAGGNDGTGANPGGRPDKGPGQDAFASSGNYYLDIRGGFLVVDASGDGIDVNGSIEMTDGVVLVSGPTEQMNGALDYDGSFNITGGFFVAAGSSGMAMAPDQTSSQSSALIFLSATQPAGTLFHIQNSAGENILTFAPAKEYQSIAFSSPALTNGTAYSIYLDGSSSGTVAGGLYQDGTYTPGTQYADFTVSGTVTTVGSGGMRRRP